MTDVDDERPGDAARGARSQAVVSASGSVPKSLRGTLPSRLRISVCMSRSSGSDHPIGRAVHDRIAERLEARDRECRRCRPERRPKALVGALMRVHRAMIAASSGSGGANSVRPS